MLPPVPRGDRARVRARGESVVMITGRRKSLIPGPEDQARDLLRGQLDRLLRSPAARRDDLPRARAVWIPADGGRGRRVHRGDRSERLGITFDCANSFFARADPAAEVAAAGRARQARAHQRLLAGALGAHASRKGRDRFRGVRAGAGSGPDTRAQPSTSSSTGRIPRRGCVRIATSWRRGDGPP